MKLLLGFIKAYQTVISPWLGNRCRFHPSCSHYTASAISQAGIMKGCFLGLWRLLRCHPFNPGGHDPVPHQPNKKLKNP